MNENGFDLWTKIPTKIKIRDQRKLIKNFHRGQLEAIFQGGSLSGGNFPGGDNFAGDNFLGGIFSGLNFPRSIFPITLIKNPT